MPIFAIYLDLFKLNCMKRLLLIALSLVLFSCNSSSGGDDSPEPTGFDRKAMLTHWADNIIVPAYTSLASSNQTLSEKVTSFTQDVNVTTLNEARIALTNAYTTWQTVNFYEVGPAKNENLRSFFNTYPVNSSLTEQLALQDDFQLHLVSNASKQGYPALDYLLNGFGNSDNEILAKFSSDENATQYKTFIVALTQRLVTLTNSVKDAWNDSYRDAFVNNDGSSASASVDLIANDFLLYYEKHYRNAKVRFPVGYDSGVSSPVNVESYYNPELSKGLFLASTAAMKAFFEGKNYDNSAEGQSFKSYLIALDKRDISTTISNGFDAILTATNQIDGTFKQAVENDRTAFLNLQDKIQENVIPMKVDMLSGMSISVAYFDGDGD